jgi:hypothetical protein
MQEWFIEVRDELLSNGVDPDPRVLVSHQNASREIDVQATDGNGVDHTHPNKSRDAHFPMNAAVHENNLGSPHHSEEPSIRQNLAGGSNPVANEPNRVSLDNFVIDVVLDELSPFAGHHPEDGKADSMLEMELRVRNFQRMRGPRIAKWRDGITPGRVSEPPSEPDAESDIVEELLGEVNPLMSEFCREGTEWRKARIKARRRECSSRNTGSET